MAKEKILDKNKPPKCIASELGNKYRQHFTMWVCKSSSAGHEDSEGSLLNIDLQQGIA